MINMSMQIARKWSTMSPYGVRALAFHTKSNQTLSYVSWDGCRKPQSV